MKKKKKKIRTFFDISGYSHVLARYFSKKPFNSNPRKELFNAYTGTFDTILYQHPAFLSFCYRMSNYLSAHKYNNGHSLGKYDRTFRYFIGIKCHQNLINKIGHHQVLN